MTDLATTALQPSGGRSMTATERAYEFTKSRVLDSTYAGGDFITEGEVAEALGMSRTPVREAFLRLQSEGLLRLYPKRGALVVPVSAGEIEAVMETRLLVEHFALGKVLAAGPAAAVADELEAAIERQGSATTSEEFVAMDREFHTVFVTAANNPIITGVYDSLRDRQQRMVITSLRRDRARMSSIIVEHRALAAAVRAGDLDEAQSVLARHLKGTLELLRRG